jgi:hypothetical protein
MKRISVYALAILFFILTQSSCWYYSFSERPYLDIETVQIEPLVNKTTEYELTDQITSLLLSAVQSSGVLKLVNRDADAKLSGSIENFDREVYTYTADEQPKEYRVLIRAKLELYDIKKGKSLWEQNFEGFGTYSADEDDTPAQQRAIDLLIQRIIQRLREG